MDGKQLKRQRVSAEIPATLLSVRSGVERSRLSAIERGYVQPSEREVAQIEQALTALTKARKRVAEVAEAVGWPL